jgi:hypothetical protein
MELNLTTGKVSCPVKSLEKAAQSKLDDSIEARTSSDVTKMIQRLFDLEADLFPVRDQGGVYFVPDRFSAFTEKVDHFINKLGGRLSRFPVPADTRQGDRSTQDAVANGLATIITEHETAIDDFGLDTRHDTLERAAERIKATRVKIEAYASYLEDRKEELLDALTEANRKLVAKVQHLSDEREKAPLVTSENGSHRAYIFGYPVTGVIRWMGTKGWAFTEARAVVDLLTGKGKISDATIRTQLGDGKSGRFNHGEPPTLTEQQAAKLEEQRTDLADPSDPSEEELEAAGTETK